MSKSKVLYSFCGTGQGHMTKAAALEKELRKRYEVEFLVSSLNNPLLFNVDHILQGGTLIFDENAKLDFSATFWGMDAKSIMKEVAEFDLKKYDFVINDHEPVTAGSAWLNGYENIFTLSHQASFVHSTTPRAKVNLRNFLGSKIFDMVISGYAPNHKDRTYGVHFDKYSDKIFYPLLREEIEKMAEDKNQDGSCIVYLPKHSKESIYSVLKEFPKQKFIVFDPKKDDTVEINDNMTFFKTDKKNFMKHLSKSSKAIVNAGFEMPSELMYLEKHFLAIPQIDQYEQECNAEALRKIGVNTSLNFDTSSVLKFLTSDIKVRKQQTSSPSEILDIIESKVK